MMAPVGLLLSVVVVVAVKTAPVGYLLPKNVDLSRIYRIEVAK